MPKDSPVALVPPPAGPENKRERFLRVMKPRVQKAINSIHRIGSIAGSNSSTYDYDTEDIEKIIERLQAEMHAVSQRLRRKEKPAEFNF